MVGLINSTACKIPLRDKSIHMVVTSPPYWGLRDYGLPGRVWGGEMGCGHVWGDTNRGRDHGTRHGKGNKSTLTGGKQVYDTLESHAYSNSQFCQLCGAWRGCLGLEPTPEMYIQHIVQVFREIRRVLRDDGTLWLNLGDSYANQGGHSSPGKTAQVGNTKAGHALLGSQSPPPGLKPKDLIGIPWRVAFALQADGWWLRSDIIWSKTNPMPESVTDRPTKAHEYLFLLSKSARYFYDADAVREGDQVYTRKAGGYHGRDGRNASRFGGKGGFGDSDVTTVGRNRRTVWTLPTKPYKGAHFATYPPALVEPCIKAGISERGVCPECGGPWERVVKKEFVPQEDVSAAKGVRGHGDTKEQPFDGWDGFPRGTNEVITTGWRPTCAHYPGADLWQEYPRQDKDESDDGYAQRMEPIRQERQRLLTLWEPMETVPATVLDPFVGSGTTLVVARQLGRNGIGLDLSFDYLSQQARKRLELDKLAAWQHGAEILPAPLEGLPLFVPAPRPEQAGMEL